MEALFVAWLRAYGADVEKVQADKQFMQMVVEKDGGTALRRLRGLAIRNSWSELVKELSDPAGQLALIMWIHRGTDPAGVALDLRGGNR